MRPGQRPQFVWRRTYVAVAILLFSLAAATASSAALTEDPAVGCPEITDSIRRAHEALLEEPPSPNAAHYWASRYQTAQSSLPEIAEAFARSDDFIRKYGNLSDVRFIDRVYRNAYGRGPTVNEYAHWQAALGNRYRRGEMVLALSESELFVNRTDTATPLAGFLRWYPQRAHWYCGTGTVENLSIIPLGDETFVDYLVRNDGSNTERFQITTGARRTDGSTRAEVTVAAGASPAGYSVYAWDNRFAGDGYYGDRLTVSAGSTLSWAVAFYPASIGQERPGWQID